MNTNLSMKKKGKGKRCFTLLALLLLPFAGFSQVHTPQSFLNVRSVSTGTNGAGITNLQSLFTNATPVLHVTNAAWTNLSGTLVRNTNFIGAIPVTNAVSQATLFKDVRLYADREGRPVFGSFLGPVTGSLSNYTVWSGQTLIISMSSPSGTNASIGFVFTPIWKSPPADSTTIERAPTTRVDDWTVTLPAGSGYTTFATNLPLWRWPGAHALRLRYITNIVDGDSTVLNSTWVHGLDVVGYRP